MPLPSRILDQNVCILGLGYVGLTLAVAMADAGFRVHGIERRAEVCALLKEGRAHFWEPRLDAKLSRVVEQGSFTFSTDVDPDFPASVYILTVGTPLGKDGRASLDAVERAAGQVASVMGEDALVILRSTVKLGTARDVVAPVLAAGGRRFELAVCPERTLEGRALIELNELPQIIGSDDPETRQRCQQLFGALTPTTIALSSLEAAELTKLVDNTYRDVMFAFANEIADLCGKAGLSAHEVISAGRLGYPRTNVALPGPVGGPCLEKDPHILVESARSFDVKMGITAAARQVNEAQPAETVRLIREAYDAAGGGAAPAIALCGLAFKGVPPTDDLRGTMAAPILAALREAFPDGRFTGFDPVVPQEAARAFFEIETVATMEEACAGASIVVIANNHPQFQRLEMPALATQMATPGIIYDYWNMHNRETEGLPEGVAYLSLGSERRAR
jgi:UDP-N-acetyl-D-mannosaminuronic acid dehydrogenase